jgi:hypothetical protein
VKRPAAGDSRPRAFSLRPRPLPLASTEGAFSLTQGRTQFGHFRTVRPIGFICNYLGNLFYSRQNAGNDCGTGTSLDVASRADH